MELAELDRRTFFFKWKLRGEDSSGPRGGLRERESKKQRAKERERERCRVKWVCPQSISSISASHSSA